jgi:negative regulator of sigma E activity
MAHVKGHGGLAVRWPRQPRLVACLAAWTLLASLVCLQRSSSAGSNCQRASGGTQEAAPAGGGAAATQLQGPSPGTVQPHRQQQQAADEWPELQGLSREQIESLIRAPAGLHGRVHKGGLPANYM